FTHNPAVASADATNGNATSYGEASASYSVAGSTLQLYGRGAGTNTLGGDQNSEAEFIAGQDFGSGQWVHIVGTLTSTHNFSSFEMSNDSQDYLRYTGDLSNGVSPV